MELQAWEGIHSQEALAGFVKGCEMKDSQQVEANHGGKEQGEGRPPLAPVQMLPAQPSSIAGQTLMRLGSQHTLRARKSIPPSQCWHTGGSACPCATCAPQHGGKAGRVPCWSWGIWLPLNSGSLLKLIFSPQQSLFVRTSVFSGNM